MFRKLISSFLFLIILSLPVSVLALVNINTASSGELESLPGVGSGKAQNIITYREQNGLFKKIEDIMNVSGIKDGIFSDIKNLITVVSESSENQSGNVSNNSINDDNNTSANTSSLEPAKLSKEDFKINAGRDRLATVRTPIIFSVISNKTGKNTSSFQWSFGDGSTTFGQKVTHAYQFPGVYNVVLNSQIDNSEEAVDRLVVTVLDSKIKITKVDIAQGFVEITNQGDKEQNINNWILRLGPKMTHYFPLDTIIGPKSSIKVPLRSLGFDLSSVTKIILAYPDGGEASGASLESQTEDRVIKIKELENKISLLKRQLASVNNYNQDKNAEIITKDDYKNNKKDNENKEVVVLEKKNNNFLEKIKNAIFK